MGVELGMSAMNLLKWMRGPQVIDIGGDAGLGLSWVNKVKLAEEGAERFDEYCLKVKERARYR